MVPNRPADALSRAIDEAILGRREALFELLARGSHLPGRMNTALADAFGHACRVRGPSADSVVLALARLRPAEAPGATPLEFLPVCGVCALGLRAVADERQRGFILAELHAHADDVRFRVRDAVVESVGRIGQVAGDKLVADVASWMDGYFHAAAVLFALASDVWLTSLRDPAAVVLRLDEAFAFLREAPRAAARWPGHKQLLLAVETASPAIASRFGVPVFDMLVRWGGVADPVLRESVERMLCSRKLAGKYAAEVARARRALVAARPPPRNPDHNVGTTRDRSRNRRKSGR